MFRIRHWTIQAHEVVAGCVAGTVAIVLVSVFLLSGSGAHYGRGPIKGDDGLTVELPPEVPDADSVKEPTPPNPIESPAVPDPADEEPANEDPSDEMTDGDKSDGEQSQSSHEEDESGSESSDKSSAANQDGQPTVPQKGETAAIAEVSPTLSSTAAAASPPPIVSHAKAVKTTVVSAAAATIQPLQTVSPERLEAARDIQDVLLESGIEVRLDHSTLSPDELGRLVGFYVATNRTAVAGVTKTQSEVTVSPAGRRVTPDSQRLLFQKRLKSDEVASRARQQAAADLGPVHGAQWRMVLTESCAARIFEEVAMAQGDKPLTPGTRFDARVMLVEGEFQIQVLGPFETTKPGVVARTEN